MTADVIERPAARPPRHRHSPRVRRLAAEADVDLRSVAGTGPSGRVTVDDVRRARSAAEHESAVVAAPATVGGPSTIVATLTSVIEVDVTDALAREAPMTAHLARAVVDALAAVPAVHGEAGHSVDLAVTGDGVCALLRDAGGFNLDGIVRRLGDDAAVPGPATFTIVDAGHRGTLWESSAVPEGQVAVLTAGAAVERPSVVRRPDGERVVAVRAVAYLALTYEAARVDPADAGRFLTIVRDRLTRTGS